MSENVRLVRIYVPLLDEGTTVARPTMAALMEDDIYRVLPTADYDPELETWKYPPGTIVRCKKELWQDGEILVATEIYAGPDFAGR